MKRSSDHSRGGLGPVFRKFEHAALRAVAHVLLPRPEPPFDRNRVRKILVYGTMGIGNIVMLTPTLRALRQGFPNAHITLLAGASGGDQVVSGGGLVDEIIRRQVRLRDLAALAWRIRRRRFDLMVATIHGNGGYLPWITALSGVPTRAGHSTGPDWISRNDFLYNVPVSMPEGQHEVERGLLLAEALGCDTTDRRPSFHFDDADRVFAEQFLTRAGILDGDWLLGVQVGTWKFQDWKQWDLDRLAEACDRLIAEEGVKVVLLGSPSDRDVLDRLLGFMTHRPIIALGESSLKQSAAIVQKCHATLCNDSGLMHVSAAVGTPVVAVFGPTDRRRTGPWGPGHVVVTKNVDCSPCFTLAELWTAKTALSCTHHKCLKEITVQDVVGSVKGIKVRTETRG